MLIHRKVRRKLKPNGNTYGDSVKRYFTDTVLIYIRHNGRCRDMIRKLVYNCCIKSYMYTRWYFF